MSIATELALLANTKESLRVAIGLSTSIPFSQYAVNIPWGSDVIPATGIVFDFKKNRYAKDGKAAYLDDVSEFIRLSSATRWQDGELVEVANNIPRISSAGLLIESQATNFILHSTDISNSYWTKQGTSVVGKTLTQDTSAGLHLLDSPSRSVPQYNHTRTQSMSIHPLDAKYIGINFTITSTTTGIVVDVSTLEFVLKGSMKYVENPRNVSISKSDGVLSISYTVDDIGGWNTVGISKVAVQFYKEFSLAYDSRDFEGDGVTSVEVLYIGASEGDVQSSEIITTTSPVTRSPDILNIPLLSTQTITGDWDAGVTYEVADNIATFTGHGYIRNITVEEL